MLTWSLSRLYIIYFFLGAIIWWPVCILLRLIALFADRDLRLLNKWTAAYTCRTLLISRGWRFTYEGLDNLESGGPFVMVANHQSYADIVVLMGIKHQFRWVSKDAVFWVPFLGWIMSLNGHVGIKRGDIASTRRMIRCCSKLLARGISIMLFPEGTRSPDGRVHTFREGAFRLAKHTGTLIVPIAIVGSRDILPKGSLRLNFKVDVTVRILPPIAPDAGSPGELTRKVHDVIESEVERIKTERLQKMAKTSRAIAQKI